MTELPLDDIQGFVLRGYTMPALRLLVLRVNDAARARRFLGALAGGDAAGGPQPPGVQLTTARPWGDNKPESCVNVGLTYDGLAALQLPDATLQSFPTEF